MKFLLMIVLIVSMIWLIKLLLRRAFKIPTVKKKAFSYNHINKAHRTADWVVRITGLIGYIILMYQFMFHDFSLNLFLILMTILFTAQDFVRAYFEWKSSENPKESILTLAEGVILIGIVLLIIQFDVLYLLAN